MNKLFEEILTMLRRRVDVRGIDHGIHRQGQEHLRTLIVNFEGKRIKIVLTELGPV